MAIYRGITYNPADVNEKAPAMKAGIYRGIKWESESSQESFEKSKIYFLSWR